MLDFGTYGTIANCFGSVSPWGTPLTSEEWGNQGDDTQEWNDPSQQTARDMLAMYIDPTATDADGASSFPNTYRYHYIVEITEPTSDKPVPVKHYTLGRFEHENSIVMPDSKTVYLSQDDTNGVMFKFVADTAGDLSAGTLFAAKLTQDAGSFEPLTTGFDVQWIELAHSDNTTIDGWIADFDDITTADFVEGQSNYLTDADAEAWAAGEANYPSVANGGGSTTAGMAMDDRIAFLESRKAARAKGATAEWRKFEGIYVNHKRAEEAVEGTDLIEGEEVNQAYVYFAIADMDNGMVDNEGDIQLSPRVKECGGVYRMPLLTGADAYDVNRIEPVVMGSTYRSTLDGAERCDVNALSQPDNVIVLDDGRIVIGEDGFQENNTLWMYDPTVNE
ncbi:PhoX family protein [Gilvimarinus sp. DA14]|nr:PhoX family protein [Gilvimarinus sp. DA14]